MRDSNCFHIIACQVPSVMLILGTCRTTFVFMCKLKNDCLSWSHVSYFTQYMSHVKCSCWILGDEEQFFVSWEKTGKIFVVMSLITCPTCMSKCQVLILILKDMLNNLFHVWPKITIYGRKWQEIFFKINTTITLSCDMVFQRIGSQLKIRQAINWFWTTSFTWNSSTSEELNLIKK